jgi:hypothetical protein
MLPSGIVTVLWVCRPGQPAVALICVQVAPESVDLQVSFLL